MTQPEIDYNKIFVSSGCRKNFPFSVIEASVYRHVDDLDPGDGLSEEAVLDLLSQDIRGDAVLSRYIYPEGDVICISSNDRGVTYVCTPEEYPEVQQETNGPAIPERNI